MNMTDVVAGAGLGVAVAFLLDPAGGSGRRAVVRDKLRSATRQAARGLDATGKDVRNRVRGILSATEGRFSTRPTDDATLIERARAKLGRVCSHPRAIDVDARDGEITVRGPILAREVDSVVTAIAGVRGVRHLVNELEPHDSSANIPSLQGGGREPGPSLDILQRRWAPATRALVTAAAVGTGVCLIAVARRVNA